MSWFSQQDYDVRCEWGADGVKHLAPTTSVFIIVDVMSFSSCVSIATSRGVSVYPFATLDDAAQAFADDKGATLATRENGLLLRPSALQTLESGTKLVLPSPNGSTLTTLTGNIPTLTGCLRNAETVANRAQDINSQVTVIAAGERWKDTRTLRPAIEDYVGAGAIIHHLGGTKSPEAKLAEGAFLQARDRLHDTLLSGASGRELHERGHDEDLALILTQNVDAVAPLLVDGAYTA